MHISSLEIARELINKHLKDEPLKILDIGSKICGDQRKLGSYRDLFKNPKWEYVGCDVVPGDNVDIVLNSLYTWQFEDSTFDVVISGQVLEHVEFPFVWFDEMARILKKTCIIIAPARAKQHFCPIDTFRYYPGGMVALARWAGLRVIEADTYLRDCYLVAEKKAL